MIKLWADKLWADKWMQGVCLAQKYSDLFLLTDQPQISISDARICNAAGTFSTWNITFDSLVDEERLRNLALDLLAVQHSSGEDRFYRLLWQPKLPLKFSIFGWPNGEAKTVVFAY
ncbi:hypothetical protein Cni_G20333 [Canna indica]|uniref:Uncharacterized protein n=1 Tax=Canna indica TaxID=4628 RepID=A0AAQ3KNP5_9LILI|nr:hypothetical protein Cni_G20333 [Canna indica]